MSAAPVVPGQGWYLAAVATVAGGIAIAAGLIAWFVLSSDARTQFVVPGRITLELPADRYVVWNDYRTLFDSTAYDLPREFPAAASIRVREAGGGGIATRPTGGEFTSKKAHRAALLTFEAAQASRYEISVEGGFAPRVVSVAPDHRLRPFIATFGAFAAIFLGLGGGFGLWAWAFFKRDAAAQKAAPPPAPAAPAGKAEDAPLRNLAALVYGLQLAGYFTGITPLAGVIVNYAKRDAVAGSWLESHFRWQIRTFWVTLAGMVVGIVTLVLVVGIFVLGITAMWFLYRAIRGWMALSEGRPMQGP